MTDIDTRPTRRLTDAEMGELPHFADLRSGSMAEPLRCDLPWTTLLVAVLIGGGLWLMIFHAIWSAFTADPSLGDW